MKYGNIGKSIGGSGYVGKRYHFNISPHELDLVDFVILVLNTPKGYFFYVIPKKEVTSNTIAFNPFSKQRSKYEKFRDRWDLVLDFIKTHIKEQDHFEYNIKHDPFWYRKEHKTT